MDDPTITMPKEHRGLLKSSGVVSLMTMISRVFGLVRDMVIAYYFGASYRGRKNGNGNGHGHR